MKNRVLAIICIVLIVFSFCSCSGKPKELKGLDITAIDIIAEYDENRLTGSGGYGFVIVKAPDKNEEDYCEFTFTDSKDPTYIWTIDADGTKHINTDTGKGLIKSKCDLNTFKNVLRIINQGNPSVYAGITRDGRGNPAPRTIQNMIMLTGKDKDGNYKTVMIDSIDNYDKLLKLIEKLKELAL